MEETTPGNREADSGLANEAYERLRSAILHARIPPGTVISQLELAKRLGVSRTPLREALYRLRTEGFVEGEIGRRPRIVSLQAADIDQAFAMRILVEWDGIRHSVPQFSDTDVAELERRLEVATRGVGTEAGWDAHNDFHEQLLVHAGDWFIREARRLREFTDWNFRSHILPSETVPVAEQMVRAEQEHTDAVAAVRRRDGHHAALVVARQLAWAGLVQVATSDHLYEPARIRSAIRSVEAASA